MPDKDAVDDLIDGLRTVPGPPVEDRSVPLGGTSRYARIPKGEPSVLTRPVIWTMVVACSVISFWCGGVLANGQPSELPDIQQASSASTPVTKPDAKQSVPPVKVVKEKLPASCTQAIVNVQRVLMQGSKLASSTDKALDILSRANQAALKGSTQEMNAAVTDLRALAHSLQGDKSLVLLAYQDIMDGLATCPAG